MTTAPVPTTDRPSTVKALRCRECGAEYPKTPIHVCEFCFGPLEIAYDYAAIGKLLTRAVIESRPHNMWRYAELLPLDLPPVVGMQTGMTPLVRADRLAKRLASARCGSRTTPSATPRSPSRTASSPSPCPRPSSSA